MDLVYSRPQHIFIIPTRKFVSKNDYHLYQCIKTETNILPAAQEQGGKPILCEYVLVFSFCQQCYTILCKFKNIFELCMVGAIISQSESLYQ